MPACIPSWLPDIPLHIDFCLPLHPLAGRSDSIPVCDLCGVDGADEIDSAEATRCDFGAFVSLRLGRQSTPSGVRQSCDYSRSEERQNPVRPSHALSILSPDCGNSL